MCGPYKVHPALAIFPMIEGKELARFVTSIKEHGLINPIVLSADGETIIDGRARYLACAKARVKPKFIWLDPFRSPKQVRDLIWSLNAVRQHLDDDERQAHAHARPSS